MILDVPCPKHQAWGAGEHLSGETALMWWGCCSREEGTLLAAGGRCVVQMLSNVWHFVTPRTATRQAHCPSLFPEVCSNSCPLSWWGHPTISFSVIPFSCLQSFPASAPFANESARHIRWPKDWSFTFSISPSNEYSGWISFRTDWLDLLTVKGTLKSLHHHS